MRVNLNDRAAIVGIGATAFGRNQPDSELDLACRAVRAALDDAGLAPADVDGLASFTMEAGREVELARTVGFGDIGWFTQVGYGGGAAPAVIGQAAAAIATGQAEVVVAWRARKRSTRDSRVWAQSPTRLDDDHQWARPFGLLRPVDEIAMLTRRYMHEYGITRDHLANVALVCRAHANRNPAAMMVDRPLTREEYLAGRWISEPLCLYDNCLESDGALAVVLVAADRARDLPHPPASVHAFAQGIPRDHVAMTDYFRPDPLHGPAWTCAERLWARAEYGPADLDCAQLYDAFTPLVLLSLEGYGICERGGAGAFTDGGGIEVGGRLPVNTSGGGLSEAYVHGFNLILEAVRQIRGNSTSQVEGAHRVLVTGGEGVPTSALLLGS